MSVAGDLGAINAAEQQAADSHVGERAQLPALELSSIVKRYGAVEAVRGIDLIVEKGECVTVLGPSGSGKTTLLRIVAGFTHATAGALRINGREVSGMSPAERGIGMVFQDYALFPHMSVEDNVGYGLKVRGWAREKRAQRVDDMLDVVGLQGMQKRLPRELSGGQQQRVALARALAFDPDLLLMDEPLGALDRDLRVRMTGELRRIQRELQTTLVYVTHDRDEALTLSDRIAIMRDGRIDSLDTPQTMYWRPETRFVAGFFGWHNVFDVEVVANTGAHATIVWHGREITVPSASSLPAGTNGLVVPTRAMRATSMGEEGDLVIEGDVLEALYMGDEVRVRVQLGNGHVLVAHLPAHQERAPVVGQLLTLSVDVSRLSIVPDRPGDFLVVDDSAVAAAEPR